MTTSRVFCVFSQANSQEGDLERHLVCEKAKSFMVFSVFREAALLGERRWWN